MSGPADPPEDAAPADRPAPRRRPPPARVAPEALAAARGGALEGLAWLGRTPESKASLLYRLTRLLVRFLCFGVFRFRVDDVRPGAHPDRRLSPRRRCPSGLDGPVRRDARAAGRAALLDPGQRPIDVHGTLARVARQADRWPAAGLARRRRDRRPRRVGASGARKRRGLRPDAGRDDQRAAGPARDDAPRLGDHRPTHRRPDPATRHGRHRGALRRPADGVPSASVGDRPRASRTAARRPSCRHPAAARSSRLHGA